VPSFELPQYMQNLTYSARLDRIMVAQLFRGKERILEGLVVTQKAGTQDNTVDVTPGSCVVQGDDITRQGMYLVESDVTIWTAGKENVAFPAKPVSNNRYDVLCVQIVDAQALGSGVENDAVWHVLSGSTASGTPPMPTITNSHFPISRVLRTSTETAILNAAIAEIAPRGYFPSGSGSSAPTGIGVAGDIYVQW
jgi:hypothetical protein